MHLHLEEKRLSGKQLFDGKVVKLFVDDVELENGSIVTREVVKHPGGVAIAALTDNDEILMVRQFRYAQGKTLLEIPAGKLEYGEDPEACGKRELLEETGCVSEIFEDLGSLLPTPAYDTERIYLFYATGLSRRQQHLDQDEFLDVIAIPFDKALAMVMSGEIDDAKTQIALLKLAARRK
jgi:ADP-ribose pyrophosphatase